jgi:hypothetical protein
MTSRDDRSSRAPDTAAARRGIRFAGTDDPVLTAVSRWLDEVTADLPEAVLRRGPLAAIAWLVGPPLDTPTHVTPRF